MTFTEAAAEVLRLTGKPLHYKEITEIAIEKNFLSHVGKSPEVTMGARLAALLKKEDKTNPIVRVKPGVFALRDWSEKRGKKKDAPVEEPEESDEPVEVNALEVEAATRAPETPAYDEEDDDDAEPVAATAVSGEDALRADLAASGADLFDDEDDDDQPILGAPPSSTSVGGPPSEGGAEGGRRRRRRRRRGRGRGGEGAEFQGERTGGGGERGSQPRPIDVIQPAAIISVESDSSIDTSRDPLAPAPRPMIRDRSQIMAGGMPTGIEVPDGGGEDLSGRELADATVMVMSGFDRNQGPVPARNVAEALMRRGRLSGDLNQATSQLCASLRADNMRRTSNGQRPRFRFGSGPRIALTDWLLSPELVRLESDALLAVERFREASRRAFLRKVQELPGHVFVELALLALERVGIGNIRPVKRAGSPGGEAHFAGVHKTGAEEVRTAIVIRKDGREIGRERVSDLRGALHHYGPASAGWLVTTGQVLSGAREEASATPAPPIALYDGVLFCKLLEDHDVAVTRTRMVTFVPDLELLETLRGT
ncbi:MAG: restriction endonuclease [Myxococcales bacterium]|jgi:hypothetical protein|nr:restriction endonuclease [Myxococcales bacterium]